ncbi:hypothetical protein C8263_17355 [Deinococcus arcticus]|uniref:Uncharacterized protein n=1 Tax=Deinococcus arcticus TaxID=2136176 RepID=A0A2T3W471_9DEIO|nr:hypothetical protein C8263_17355 [Deinococcus arcticus]
MVLPEPREDRSLLMAVQPGQIAGAHPAVLGHPGAIEKCCGLRQGTAQFLSDERRTERPIDFAELTEVLCSGKSQGRTTGHQAIIIRGAHA